MEEKETNEKIETNKGAGKKKSKKKLGAGLKIFLIVIVILAIATGVFAKKMHDLDGNWLAVLLGHNEETLKDLDKLYILVMGESTGMSDTIIVCAYDPQTQEASMLSIPRDTFIGDSKYNATTFDKINALYNSGETPDKTIEAVNKITGLDIQYYILVDTEALVKLVDTIGGIDFDVPIDMNYDDNIQNLHIHLEAGYQHLDGSQVEQLVRFRHNADGSTYSYEYGMEDFGRMKTQREVIITVAKQTIQLKNITEIGNLIDILEEYVKTNMDLQSLKDYIPYIIDINIDNIQAEQLPGQSTYLNGISFFLLDEEDTKEVVDRLFNGISDEEETTETENTVNNTVNNT